MVQLPIDNDKLSRLCKRNDINYLGVFGSYVRGEHDQDSDIDLLVRFKERKSLLDLVRLENELSETMGRKVDLLTEGAISPYLKDSVLSNVQPVYGQ